MSRGFAVLVLALLLATFVWSSDTRILVVPFHYREDFESGELKSWAAYPPAQDVALDLTLTPTSTQALGRYSLLRTYQPVRSGKTEFGAVKRLRFLVSASFRLQFSYYTHSYFSPESLRVVLCGGDGKRYEYNLAHPLLDRWQKAKIPFESFRASGQSPEPGLEIQAIYWELRLSTATPKDRYLLYLDDLEITGERPAQFALAAPPTLTTPERETLLATKEFRRGDILQVTVHQPREVPKLTEVHCAVTDPSGNAAGSVALTEQRTGAEISWSSPFPLRIARGARYGEWHAEVTGTTAHGALVKTQFEFLVTDRWPKDVHPRLYFRQQDRERLIALTRRPELVKIWEEIRTDARRLRETANIEAGREIGKLASNPSRAAFGPYRAAMRQVENLVQTNALVYWLTGDRDAKEAAKRGLLEAARWPTWTMPWFEERGRHSYYPVGMFTAALAFGYDLLYPELTPQEREVIRQGILEKGVANGFREYYLDNQLPFPTSNWISHIAGGALIGLMAVSEERQQAEPYFSGLLQELRQHWSATYLADGSYGECIDYQRFDLVTSAPTLAALKNVLGLDLAKEYRLAASQFYPLYAFMLPDRYLDFGDTSDGLLSLAPWAWLASYTHDSHLQWYYEQYLQRRALIDDTWRVTSNIFNLVWHDPQLAANPPADLPTSKSFLVRGGAIFRSGWDADSLILNLTAGPFFNHNHFDQGSFWLAAFGEILLAEAGITDYYADEFYQSYFIQPVGHNTLLVDGEPASQRIADHWSDVAALNRYPRMATALTTEVHDQVRVKLDSVYRDLSGFERSLMFVKPRYFVLFDRIAAADDHRYSEIFHPQYADDLEIGGTQAWIRKSKARLWMKFLAPDNVRLKKQPGHIPLTEVTKLETHSLRERAYLEASTPESTRRAAFLVLLFPQRATESGLPQVEKIAGPGLVGLQVRGENTLDRIGFAVEDGARLSYQDLTTDGLSFRVSESRTGTRTLSFEQATFFELAGKTLLRADRPVSGIQQTTAHGADWQFVASPAAQVEVYVESPPARVLLDGKQLDSSEYSYQADSRTVRVQLTAGEHLLSITS